MGAIHLDIKVSMDGLDVPITGFDVLINCPAILLTFLKESRIDWAGFFIDQCKIGRQMLRFVRYSIPPNLNPWSMIPDFTGAHLVLSLGPGCCSVEFLQSQHSEMLVWIRQIARTEGLIVFEPRDGGMATGPVVLLRYSAFLPSWYPAVASWRGSVPNRYHWTRQRTRDAIAAAEKQLGKFDLLQFNSNLGVQCEQSEWQRLPIPV